MQDFHKIRAWAEATDLAVAIRRITARFPQAEYRALRNQMVRSAESIADNIAEGAGAATNSEFARYLDMSIKSSSELESQIERCHRYQLTREADHADLVAKVVDVRKMTWSLRQRVLGIPPKQPDPLPQSDDETRITQTNNG